MSRIVILFFFREKLEKWRHQSCSRQKKYDSRHNLTNRVFFSLGVALRPPIMGDYFWVLRPSIRVLLSGKAKKNERLLEMLPVVFCELSGTVSRFSVSPVS